MEVREQTLDNYMVQIKRKPEHTPLSVSAANSKCQTTRDLEEGRLTNKQQQKTSVSG